MDEFSLENIMNYYKNNAYNLETIYHMQWEQVVHCSTNKYLLSNIYINCLYIIKMLAYLILRETVLDHFTKDEVVLF